MIDEWNVVRSEIKEVEALEHPDITDILGRTWTWKSGDVYVHDSMAWPESLIKSEQVGWPDKLLLENPNYKFCSLCIEGISS